MINAWQNMDLAREVESRNESFLARERGELAEYFNTVEKSPLTDDQIDAVVRYDNRVRVIAAAGSSKTSTMVARASCTLKREIAPPTQILMLAFNKKAAAELDERARARLGEQATGITARTFHRFGLDVTGAATGKKPMVAPDVADGTGRLRGIVDVLRDTDVQFRRCWDLFRLVYATELPTLGDAEEHEDWDRKTKKTGFRTLAGEIVNSKEERLLANWLFYQGVRYEYERPYEHDTADSTHRQYCPDFYYPDIDTYHERWAIGANGQPPPHFQGYPDGMVWKKKTHARHATTLLETTSASVRNGTAFEYLARELTSRGIVLDENPVSSPRISPNSPSSSRSGTPTMLASSRTDRTRRR
ncbi:UvrD-helicase domain-containing protein [Microbacterium sp. NPDC089698]|uniref:UvrD-helicase domain-containing protein n=1 Tax=Microbacterium sp. NPDC089698 TaxID=3364200 RepID=UPI00381531BB